MARHDHDGTPIVEEIKSVRRGGVLAPAVAELYARQAGLYAWMLRTLEKRDVRAELILVEIGSERVERQSLELNFQVIEAVVKRRLNSIIRGFESQQEAAAARRSAALKLEFPHSAVRPGQGEIITRVEESLEQGSHLLLEAPTGIGKTVAALYPALRYALEHDKKIYVLTAKTLQQEMATAVLSLLNQDKAFSSLRLRAKAKMCANSEVICHEEYCPYARDYYSKVRKSQVLEKLIEEAGTLLPDRIFETAREAEVCPFEVSLELGSQAKVVVCGLNPHAGEKGLFGSNEEERIIKPAIENARTKGIDVEGPLPADTAFLPWKREATDVFVCMYHDQGHIPVKTLAFDSAVNTTLGLSIIRTSVDHGTALDIAWEGKADPSSMYCALRLAVKLVGS